MTFHTFDDKPYWDESACYEFSMHEVEQIEKATTDLHGMYIEAAQEVITNGDYDKLKIPKEYRQAIEDSWNKDEPTLYGRFDFRYDGVVPPRLLEYNADTPTALLEASVVQWYWLEDAKKKWDEAFVSSDIDQFNSIHEKLVESWKGMGVSGPVWFSSLGGSEEDQQNVLYLLDAAHQAGLQTNHIKVEDIGWNADKKQFVDGKEQHISNIFKLYPWEWMLAEKFGKHVFSTKTRWIEPVWKMLWSNKAMLAVLWEMFPNHPNLLPTFFKPLTPKGQSPSWPHCKKPILGREGANVELCGISGMLGSGGDQGYGEEGFVYQELCLLPTFGGKSMLVGSWVIGGQAAGMGIREDDGPITGNLSRFVPHYIEVK
jgi:glutathionylspermidine synthase